MDGYIFKNMDNDEYGVLAPNVRQELFKMFELKQIMRQRESKDFAKLLNRLREGNHTKQDIQKLSQRIRRALSKNVLTHILGFLNLCSKVVDFLHVTQHYCIC